MKRGIVLAFLALAAAACSKTEDPHQLVADADAMLVTGGIEDAKTRALAEQKYDRAIRIICGEEDLTCVKSGNGGSPGTNDYSLAHAHFGLAFARSFDLVERIRQLYASGTILQPEQFTQDDSLGLGEDGDANTQKTEDVCKQQLNLPQLVPLLKTIVDTSLLPIVKDLKSVTNYSDFSVEYSKAFLDFKFLNPSAEEALGIEFGTDETTGLTGKFTVKEAYAALAVFRVITVGAEAVFSYNDLTQALIVFLPKIDLGTEARPFEISKVFNSDECTTNPLFEPAFGVLTEAGRDTYADIEVQLGDLFAEQKAGFELIAKACDSGDKDSILNCSSGKGGTEWASNLAKRIHTGNSTDDDTLENSINILTGAVTPDSVSKMFASLDQSLTNGKTFDFTAFVKSQEALADLLVLANIDVDKLGIPAVSLRQFFTSPISDLKSIMPLTYASSEKYDYDTPGEGEHAVSKQEMPIADQKNKVTTMSWKDVNSDGHLNLRGDFIVQVERESFYDDANDNRPLEHPDSQRIDVGVVGTFWDGDRNGVPDAGFEGLTPGTAKASPSPATGAVLWSAGALTYATSATYSEDETYRDYFDATQAYSNGCLDFVPILSNTKNQKGREKCTVELGDVLGHVWPNVFPEAYEPPGASDDRRKDPANGSVDKIYMFYPNPSLNGMLQSKEAGGGYRPFANHELNRFIGTLLSAGDFMNDISQAKK